MTDRIRQMAEKINETDIYPEVVPVEYDPFDLALPEATRIAKRLHEYVLAQPVLVDDWQLFFGHFRFDGSVESDLFHRTGHKKFSEATPYFYNKPYDNLVTFEWQHSTPDYEKVIKRGLKGLLFDIQTSKCFHKNDVDKIAYLNALESMCHTIIAWSHKCGDVCLKKAETETDEQRKAELLRAHHTLYKVPEYPAETFYEAMQTIYMCFEFLPDSVGTIDRFLVSYYENDLKNGILDKEQAKEMLQSLFFRLQGHTPLRTDRRGFGGECHFAIGGYLEDGTDGFSSLSRLIVEALMEIPMHCPQISLRWTSKTPREVLHYMLDCERHDKFKRIAFVNDEPRIKGFMENLNIPYEQAVKYTMVGCNEPAFQGSIWFGGNTTNIARSLTNTLYKCTDRAIAAKDFEEFYALYEENLEKDLEQLIDIANKFNAMRGKDINVASALFLNGCIENATSPTASGCSLKLGGANLMGLTCVIDSLSIIKQFVYDEKEITMEYLIDVLKSNWEKDPALRLRIYKTGKFFGNNDALSDNMAQRFTNSLHRLTKDKRLANGERILFGTLAGYNPHYAFFGNLTEATPDARFKGEPFMVGVGQTGGKDREGLTALLSSVAQMQPTGILCGPYLLNVLIDQMLIQKDEYFEKIVQQIETYFKMGGMHIQLNYVSAEELEAAQKTPEKYNSLKVRVSGYSGVFVTLKQEIQQDILRRTRKGV